MQKWIYPRTNRIMFYLKNKKYLFVSCLHILVFTQLYKHNTTFIRNKCFNLSNFSNFSRKDVYYVSFLYILFNQPKIFVSLKLYCYWIMLIVNRFVETTVTGVIYVECNGKEGMGKRSWHTCPLIINNLINYLNILTMNLYFCFKNTVCFLEASSLNSGH